MSSLDEFATRDAAKNAIRSFFWHISWACPADYNRKAKDEGTQTGKQDRHHHKQPPVRATNDSITFSVNNSTNE